MDPDLEKVWLVVYRNYPGSTWGLGEQTKEKSSTQLQLSPKVSPELSLVT